MIEEKTDNVSKKMSWVDFKDKSRGGGLLLTLLCRMVAQRVAYLFYMLNMSPNQVTAIGVATTIVGVMGFFLFENLSISITAILVLILLFGLILDCCDGQLARATNCGSKFGEWIDHVVDNVLNCLIYFAAGYIIFKGQGFSWLGFIALFLHVT